MKIFSQLKSAFLELLGSAPAFSATEKGRIIYDESDDTPKINNGTEWTSLGGGGGAVAPATVDFNIADNQTTLADVTGFFADPALLKGFDADVVVTREAALAAGSFDPKWVFSIAGLSGSFDPRSVINYRGHYLIGGQQWDAVSNDFSGACTTRDGKFTDFFDFSKLQFPSNTNIEVLSEMPDGKLIVVHDNTSTFSNSVRSIVKVNDAFEEDSTFTSNAGTGLVIGTTYVFVQVHNAASVYITGATSYNGDPQGKIVKIDQFGNRDITFFANKGTGFNSDIRGIVLDSNGNLYISGDFTTYDGVPVPKLVKLSSDGVLDATFSANVGTPSLRPFGIDIRSDDNLILVFPTPQVVSGSAAKMVHKVSTSGISDNAFVSVVDEGNPFMPFVDKTDDSIIITGTFNSISGGSLTRDDIVFLDSTGADRPALYAAYNGGAGLDMSSPQLVKGFYDSDHFVIHGNASSQEVVQPINMKLTTSETQEQFSLQGYYNNATKWSLGKGTSIGEDTGVTLDMYESGQLNYRSDGKGDTGNSSIRFRIKEL